MTTTNSWPAAGALIVLAVIFFVLALLYAQGTINYFASSGHVHHYTHAAVMGVLGVLCLVGANFARPRSEPDI